MTLHFSISLCFSYHSTTTCGTGRTIVQSVELPVFQSYRATIGCIASKYSTAEPFAMQILKHLPVMIEAFPMDFRILAVPYIVIAVSRRR